MAYANFTALYLSLQRLGEVVDLHSIYGADAAVAMALVPNDRSERATIIDDLTKATLKWLNKASVPTLDEVIAAGKLANGTFFTHEGAFYGKGIGESANRFREGKPLKVTPTLHTKLKGLARKTILKVQVHPRNYTGDSAIDDLSGLKRLFLVARLTASTPPVLRAQAYAIGYPHIQGRWSEDTPIVARRLSGKQKLDRDYQCYGDSVHIPGNTPTKRSNVLEVNGKKILIGDALFRLFLRLVVELYKGKGGWVYTHTLKAEGVIANALSYQIYSNLRAPLRGALEENDVTKFIENDGSKRYRISTPPDFITYDRLKLLHHPDPQIRNLAKRLI